MAQRQIGPYALTTPLGEGGMGVVWRAEHLETGQAVALKTVRLLHERQLDGLRREVRALSRISHPGIVRILDQGIHEGAPWYTMELVEGPSLRQRARSITEGPTSQFLGSNFHIQTRRTTVDIHADPIFHEVDPPPEEEPKERPPAANGKLQEILNLARALCDPIAFLHGEGIVHRDLKPENVLVMPDGRPVIVDFGLVSQGSAGREKLTVDAVLHGTVSYMGPEQIRGELVDARCDLYALGVILYEMVCGRLPFKGPSVGANLFQTLQGSPLLPSRRVTGVPPELDDLIMALLAKRREDRPGYASDIAEVLESMGAERPPYPVPSPRAYLYRPRFSGRDSALETMKHSLALGRGVLLLGGENGVGKTRVALEFAHEVAARGRAVLVGECYPADAGSAESRGGAFYPLRPALQVVADRCLQDASAMANIIGQRGRVLARYQPALLAVPGIADAPVPERLEPGAERIRTLRWLTQTLSELGGSLGTVLLLDDVQWADPLTLDWLLQVARSDIEGLLVICTHGLDESHAAFSRLHADEAVIRLEIRALDRSAVSAMAEDMLAFHNVPKGLVDFLHARSDGNPFLVAEYLRAAVNEGALVRRDLRWHLASEPDADDSAWHELPVPHRLEDLVLSRVGRLGPLALTALQAAAVAGGDVEPARIAQVADPNGELQEDDWLDALSELLDAAVVVAEQDRIRFAHDQVRDVIYEDLPSQRRAMLHASVARALEEGGQTSDPGVLGHHWLRAGEQARGALWTLRAAHEALEQVAFGDAERLLRTALDLDALNPMDQIAARIALGARVLSTAGRNAEALEVLEKARAEARASGDLSALADVTAALGDVAATVGRLSDAMELHREELALRRTLGHPQTTARSLLRVASGLVATGSPDQAGPMLDEALGLAGRANDPVVEGEVLLATAGLRAARTEALELLRRAKARFDHAGVRLQQARVLERMAGLDKGEQALERYQQALELYRAIGERVRTGRVLASLGRTFHEVGNGQQAWTHYAEALELFRETGHHRFRGHALHGLALHLRSEGRQHEAEGLNRQALTLLTVVGDRPWILKVRLELSRLALERGASTQAHTHAQHAAELAEALGDSEALSAARTLIDTAER